MKLMMLKKFGVLAVILVFFLLGSQKGYAATSIDLSNPDNYTLRFDGANASLKLTSHALELADIDNNGKEDIIAYETIGSASAGIYIILDSLVEDLIESGVKNIDLANQNNYSLKITAPYVSAFSLGLFDYNGDGKIDLFSNNRTETNVNVLYIIENSLLNQHILVKTVNITSADVYSIKIIPNLYAIFYVGAGDLDNNGADDLVFEHINSSVPTSDLVIIRDSILKGVSSPGGTLNLGLDTDFSFKITNAPLRGNFVPIVSDLDGDGKTDIIFGNKNASFGDTYSGTTYVIFGERLDQFELNGNTIDWDSQTVYNLRIDGKTSSGQLGWYSQSFTDVNNNGKLDILLGDQGGSYLYIFLDSFWSQYKDDIGTVLPLNDANNYSLRISYPGASLFGYGHTFKGQSSDLNGDGKNDFVYNWHKNAVFVIHNAKFDSLAQAGKNIDVSNTDNYDLRYYYSAGAIEFASAAFMTGDINGDGRTDLAIGARNASFNSRTNSGSAYLILNFPHDIELVGAGMYNAPFELAGSVTITNSTTALSSVKWSSDDDPEGEWTECVASDGAFDEDEEDYVCDTSSLTEGSHTIYTKACDNLNSCTISSSYASVEIEYDKTVPSLTLSINDGEEITKESEVELDITSADNYSGVEKIMVCEDSEFTGCEWESYVSSKTLALSTGDGVKTIYAKVKDGAGNISEVKSAQITMDTTSPALSIEIGSDYTATKEINISLRGEDSLSGLDKMVVCESSEFTGCEWEAYSATKTLTLSTGDGVKTIYAKVKDKAGNESEVAQDTIILDTVNNKPVITQLGLIKSVSDKDNLYYHFDANKARIYGTAESNSTVVFDRVNGTKHTTQTDAEGKFFILIDLPNGETKLTYSSTDLAGNVSGSRIITLNIDPYYVTSTEETTQETVAPDEEEVAEEITTPTEQEDEAVKPGVKSLLVVDSSGNILTNKTIEVEGKKYTTDEKGYIHTDTQFSEEMIASIEGRKYTIDSANTYLTLTEADESNKNFNYLYCIVPVFIIIAPVIILAIRKKKSK